MRQSQVEHKQFSTTHFDHSLCLKHDISKLPLRRKSNVLCKCSNYQTAHLSPALNGSSEVLHFQHGDANEIRNGVMFVFYHICSFNYMEFIHSQTFEKLI